MKKLDAGVAQLVEHHLAKVDVEGSNPFARSIQIHKTWSCYTKSFYHPKINFDDLEKKQPYYVFLSLQQ